MGIKTPENTETWVYRVFEKWDYVPLETYRSVRMENENTDPGKTGPDAHVVMKEELECRKKGRGNVKTTETAARELEMNTNVLIHLT